MLSDFQPVHEGYYLEGLLVDGDDIWLTDVTVGGVRNVRTGQVVLADRTMIGGLHLNRDGALLVSGLGGIAWVCPKTGASGVLIDGLAGVNEMRGDGAGGLLFGTIDLPAILRGQKPGPSSICRLSTDRKVQVLREGLAFANGLSLDAAGSTLWFNESFAASRAFTVGEGFALGEARTVADKPDCDGMALDIEGNVWITGFASPFLLCLAPDGREKVRVAIPGKAATNVRFGGPDMRDVYVTTVDPASAQALAEGRSLTERNSVLWRGRSAVPGAPVAPGGFALL